VPERKPRLVWLGVARSPYNDFLFARLATRYALTVVYQKRAIATHPWELGAPDYPVLYVREASGAVLRAIRRADVTVMSGWNDPAYLALMPVLRRPRAFWTDTPDTRPRAGPRGIARRALVRAVFHHFDELWSTGRPGRETLIAMGCDPGKTRELPFFLDLERLPALTPAQKDRAAAFRAQHHGEGRVVFLGAGQLAAKKRYADAIEALADLGREDAVLWLCGTGPEEARLRELAARRGVADRVVLHGWMQPADMETAFVASDVFVHPAARDPFPTVVLDAMTWGKPVIGSDVSGSVLDRVDDGVQGYVVPEGDVAAIRRAMRAFVDEPARVATMGRASRARAERYPVSLAFERVDALLGRGPGPSGRA
jgi:glycosyltransferase involved in cell wall biosynthesis